MTQELKTYQAEELTAVPAPRQETAVAAPITPMEMINSAIERGADVGMLEKLMGLQERWEANQARKAFDNAMAAAKSEIPVIGKDREVEFGADRAQTRYRHETLAAIDRTVTPILAKYGLSYRFRTSSPPNEPVTVTCVISHRDGHSEENTLQSGRDDSGKKNAIQSMGSTLTYLQRYTLKAALGLSASEDDDGQSAEACGPITEDQAQWLRALADEVAADIPRFCRYLGAPSIADIPAKDYDRAIKALEKKGARA